MIKKLALTTLSTLFFIGCGGGTTSKGDGTVAATQGEYNLWDYMTPNSSNTNTFSLSSKNKNSTYVSTYTVKSNRVEEVDDYAKNEKTIYEKQRDKIIVRFKKDNKANGFYALKLTADIGDTVTLRSSSCKLSKHYDTFTLSGKSFQDVIEITCASQPGYYQKGIGEIAQIENSGKNIRILSN